jgi:DNA-binding NarL/FixJ family response regulator
VVKKQRLVSGILSQAGQDREASLISVVIADDHVIFREGLRVLLSAVPNLRIVGEAGDGLEAMQLVERLQPDVLVLDLMMSGLNGLEVARQVSHRVRKTRVVVLSMHTNEAYVLNALRNGAAGYVPKGSGSTELVLAIQEVAKGRRYLSSPLSERAIETYIQKTQDSSLDLYETLTTREREVLQLAAQSCNNADIATRLSISPRTVESYRTNVMRKLGLHTPTDLIRYALRHGILQVDD